MMLTPPPFSANIILRSVLTLRVLAGGRWTRGKGKGSCAVSTTNQDKRMTIVYWEKEQKVFKLPLPPPFSALRVATLDSRWRAHLISILSQRNGRGHMAHGHMGNDVLPNLSVGVEGQAGEEVKIPFFVLITSQDEDIVMYMSRVLIRVGQQNGLSCLVEKYLELQGLQFEISIRCAIESVSQLTSLRSVYSAGEMGSGRPDQNSEANENVDEQEEVEAIQVEEEEDQEEKQDNALQMTVSNEDAEFLDNALCKPEDLIPPSSAEWPDYECTATDDLLETARIFDCVIPTFGELQYLPASSLGSSSSSSATHASSPSSSSWIPSAKQDEVAEKHSSCAPSTPSLDQDATICADSATSSSYQSRLGPVALQRQCADNENSNKKCYLSQTGNGPTEPDSGKIDVLEELQNLDLLDWDPFSVLPQAQNSGYDNLAGEGTSRDAAAENERFNSEELPKVFFEWLKSNRDSISPQDLRSIKLKTSTIENAAKHLGGGKQGMLHLLKLILAWVQNHHLQRKRKLSTMHQNKFNTEARLQLNDGGFTTLSSYFTGAGGGGGMDHFNLWNAGQVHENGFYEAQNCGVGLSEPSMFAIPSAPSASSIDALHPAKYRRIPATPHEDAASFRDVSNLVGNGCFAHPNPISTESCQGMVQAINVQDGSAAWAPQMAMLGAQNQHNYGGLGSVCGEKYRLRAQSQVDYLNTYRSANPAATTKEARKNRMARQRRSVAHHHHHHHHSRHWSSVPTNTLPAQPSEPVNLTLMQYQRQSFMQSDRRQGWKPEKNLKFLLQKVLKQSDVGNLGRIVLPKKEAETHLPELEARDGISIAMEDIVTSRVWNMRYRFWPNNKSRMYLLENTGDFVRSNGLQEGDFIVIYSDTKTGKYMIRGVKVPRSDTSAHAPATKSTSASSVPDGEDAAKLLKIGKSYCASTSHSVGVTFADSMGDASSSVSDGDGDPFLKDMVNNEFSKDHIPHLEKFPSLDSGDLTFDEILDLVDSPDMLPKAVNGGSKA
eukprot:Gb_01768 [translate_table: standard]